MSDHLDAWGKYALARKRSEEAKDAASRAYAEMKAAEAKLIDAMLEEEVSSWKDTSGASIGMKRSFTIACNADNADQVEEWLRTEAGDAEPYKKVSLDKAAVTAYVKSRCEEKQEDPAKMPAFLNVSTRPIIAVRGWEKHKEGLSDD